MKNNGIRLHLPAIPYTITRDEYSHDAYTGKVKRFSPMMRSLGFEVYHYGVETSESGADKHFDLMTKDEWNQLRIESIMYLDKKLTLEEATKKNSDPTMIISDLSNWSAPLAKEFNRRFRNTLQEHYRGRQTDIVCLPLGRMHEDGVKGLANCLTVETGIGYSGSFTEFRIFETHAWMSKTLGVENKQPHNYWFVIPNFFDIAEFKLCLTPTPKKIGFLGRLTSLKGCGIVSEIAKRFPSVQFVLCGSGDPAPFLKSPNVVYKPPIHGSERSDYLGSCDAVLCLSKFLEPFCGVAVEAQLCGTPVVCSDWGGMVETVEHLKTGLRGRTVADYCRGVQMALDGEFDRAYIRQRAARLFDMYALAHNYEYAFRSMLEIYAPGKNGWYSPDTYIAPISEVARNIPLTQYPEYSPIRTTTNIRLHIPAVPYTITCDEYSHCAFTDRVQLFSPMMRSRGFEVYHYGVEGSQSGATRNFDLMTKAEWTDLRIQTLQFIEPGLSLNDAKKKNEDKSMVVNHLSNFNSPLTKEFNRRFRLKIQENYRGTTTDIVCLPLSRTYQSGLDGLGYVVSEIGIGYEGSYLDFRIFDSYSWMSRALGSENKQPSNYWFVIPHPCDLTQYTLSLSPNPLKVGFLGRITSLKGCGIIKEVAKRFPHVQFILCGQGDPKPFIDVANVIYKPPIHGRERSVYLGDCVAFIHPAKYLEPFGCGPVEAQLCGTPVICSDWGGMTETVEQGKTGLRCHTIADFCYGVQMALDGKFDRTYIRKRAASKYDMYRLAYEYEYAFKTILDLNIPGKNGWYSPDSYIPCIEDVRSQAPPRIYLFIPYYGAFPNYFQLYLDSLGINADILTVFLFTDIDLAPYKLPKNLVAYTMAKSAVQTRAAKFIQDVYGKSVDPSDLLKDNYKFVDFKIVLPILFDDVLQDHGVRAEDFVGWGDIDLIYGKLSNFIKFEDGFGIIGGWHGHFMAIQNTAEFKYNFKGIPNYLDLITDNRKTFITDEIAYREPLKKYLADKKIKMCYINASFCDIVPPCFYHMSRPDHAKWAKNFYDLYNSKKNIDHLYYEKQSGELTVFYDDGSSRETSYCHLQKRKMTLPFAEYEAGYCIHENGFSIQTEIPLKIWQTWVTKDLPPGMKKCVETLKAQNPEFEHRVFDDADCRDFLAEYFPREVLAAYNALIPGAYKADLWRYCILYVFGGIYLDIKMQLEDGFKLYSLVGEEHYVSDGISTMGGVEYKNLYNGLMVCKKGSPILLHSIVGIVHNVSTKYLGLNPWMPTGPGHLGLQYYRTKSTSPIDMSHCNSILSIKKTNRAIVTHYSTYRNEQKVSSGKYYMDLWKEGAGAIYKDSTIDLQDVYTRKSWPGEFHRVLEDIMVVSTTLQSLTTYAYDDKFRLGARGDGGYVLANLKDTTYDCYISAGVSNEESFSRDFINKYAMNKGNSFAFDGTIAEYPFAYTKDITFTKNNINNYNDETNTDLSYILDTHDNIFLKMDIEGGEYPWILSLEKEHLVKIKQIVMELHGIMDDSYGTKYGAKVKCLKKLASTHYLVHVHGNNWAPVVNGVPNVIEVTYVNKSYFQTPPALNTQSLPIPNMDYPNKFGVPDIDLNISPFTQTPDKLHMNVILKGHFRTFPRTHASWETSLAGCRYNIYMHAWDTVDSDTKTWYDNKTCNTALLTPEQKDLLRKFDPGCVIEKQEFTEEEKADIVLSRPYKTFLYFWQGIHSALARIQKESKYILIGRYDISVNIDFKNVTCEEDEIVIGYMNRVPKEPFLYGMTDIIFMIHYKDKHKLMKVPQNILDLQRNPNADYRWSEDPVTDFFRTNWKKVTPKWFGTTNFTIVRQAESDALANIHTYHTKYGIVSLYKNEMYISAPFKKGGYWDEDTLLKMKEYINKDRNILEIGGHCGTSSLVYSSLLNSGKKIFVYEPQKNMYDMIVKNVQQNHRQDMIIPTNMGVFCYKGVGKMSGTDVDGAGGSVSKRYSEESNLACNFGGIGLGSDGETIHLTTIDDMQLDDIGFIHCDAQGSENFIFSKGLETITRCRPVILYENIDLYGKYLYNTICKSYPEYKEESVFDIKKFCMETLKYTKFIDRFNGGIDTLLIP